MLKLVCSLLSFNKLYSQILIFVTKSRDQLYFKFNCYNNKLIFLKCFFLEMGKYINKQPHQANMVKSTRQLKTQITTKKRAKISNSLIHHFCMEFYVCTK